jgi:transcriptional regulator with XRE-family HTH domain
VARSRIHSLGRNLNRLRNRAGLTQERLAEKSDLSLRYVQEIEAGEKSPSVESLSRLRRSLACTWNDLFRGV